MEIPHGSSGLTSQCEGQSFYSPGTAGLVFYSGVGTATHIQPPQEIDEIPAAHRRPVSAKSTLKMGGWIKSSLSVVGWDNVCHSLHVYYGNISLYTNAPERSADLLQNV